MRASVSAAARPLLSGKRLLTTLGLWIVVTGAIAVLTFLLFHIATSSLTAIIVAEAYTLLIIALVIVLRPRFSEIVALRSCRLLDIALAIFVCLVAYAVTALIQGLLAPRAWTTALSILGAIGADDGRLASGGALIRVIIIARACVLAAIGEELLFRGAFYTWLRQRLSARAAIVISAAAFAVIHGFPQILLLAFFIGVGFGWVRERSQSIVPSIVVHVLHNVILISLSYVLSGWTARLPQWGSS
jgi:membrane protease YdiL (CAAX protease family)